MTTKARNYRLETTFKDGHAVTVALEAPNDWSALDTLLCTAQAVVISPANDVTTFCLLKERADGSWGRIARIMRDTETNPHWADCATRHGGSACDMGPQCGTVGHLNDNGEWIVRAAPIAAPPVPVESDPDPYEGSFREAADNEGARIAAEAAQKDEDES